MTIEIKPQKSQRYYFVSYIDAHGTSEEDAKNKLLDRIPLVIANQNNKMFYDFTIDEQGIQTRDYTAHSQHYAFCRLYAKRFNPPSNIEADDGIAY